LLAGIFTGAGDQIAGDMGSGKNHV
jgi:hypothetical protein